MTLGLAVTGRASSGGGACAATHTTMGTVMTASSKRTSGDIENEIAQLEALNSRELRKQWRRFYHSDPPAAFSRDLRIRAITFKMQERVHGSLPKAVERRLRNLVDDLDDIGNETFPTDTILRPGTKLLREWHGKTHTVVALEDGFEYEGRWYRSLTMVARAITGAHWSGPRFFGTRRASTRFSAKHVEDPDA